MVLHLETSEIKALALARLCVDKTQQPTRRLHFTRYEGRWLLNGTPSYQTHVTRRRQAAKPKRRLDVAKLQTTTGRADQCKSMQRAFASSSTITGNSINDDWEFFRCIVYTAAAESVGYPRRVNADWFDYNDPTIEILIRDKRAALQERLSNPLSEAAIQHHAQNKSKLQLELRHMEDSWWDSKAGEVQALSDRGDSRGVFQWLKSIFGPRRLTNSPMLTADGNTLLTSKPDTPSRWKDYYC